MRNDIKSKSGPATQAMLIELSRQIKHWDFIDPINLSRDMVEKALAEWPDTRLASEPPIDIPGMSPESVL